MRALAFLCAGLVFAACKKHEKAAAPPDPPPAHHANGGPVKLKGDTADASGSSASATAGSNGSGATVAAVPDDGGVVDASTEAKPAYRDQEGHVHGPGGPVFLGTSPFPCDPAHNHCLRKHVWFQAPKFAPNGVYGATPVFEFEKAWYTWLGQPSDTDGALYMTRSASSAPSAGTKVIFYNADPDEGALLPETEYEALTASSWSSGIVLSASGGTIRIGGAGDIPLNAIRLITETRGF